MTDRAAYVLIWSRNRKGEPVSRHVTPKRLQRAISGAVKRGYRPRVVDDLKGIPFTSYDNERGIPVVCIFKRIPADAFLD